MHAEIISDGGSVDLVAESDIQAGEVVVRGELVLVATSAIKAGDRGGLRRTGGAAMTKAPGEAIPFGTRVFWNAAAGRVSAKRESEDDRSAGVTFADALAGDETASVLLGA